MSPEEGTSSPASKVIKVDFPAPDTPMKAIDSPCSIFKDTSCKIDKVCSLLVTDLDTLVATITGVVMFRVLILFFVFLSQPLWATTLLVLGDSLSAGYQMPLAQVGQV